MHWPSINTSTAARHAQSWDGSRRAPSPARSRRSGCSGGDRGAGRKARPPLQLQDALLVAIQRGIQQARAEGQRGHAGGDLAGVLLRVGLRLRAAVLQILARGVQVFVDVDISEL